MNSVFLVIEKQKYDCRSLKFCSLWTQFVLIYNMIAKFCDCMMKIDLKKL